MQHKTAPLSTIWYTPTIYLNAVREVFDGPIDLDPASSAAANDHVGALRYYDETMDGLSQDWVADNVFLNPPYGRRDGKTGPWNLVLWSMKLADAYDSGAVGSALLLCNAATSTAWFHRLASRPICFVSGRIVFIDGHTGETQKKNPAYDSMFVYYGTNPYRFSEVFSKFGAVMEWISPLSGNGQII